MSVRYVFDLHSMEVYASRLRTLMNSKNVDVRLVTQMGKSMTWKHVIRVLSKNTSEEEKNNGYASPSFRVGYVQNANKLCHFKLSEGKRRVLLQFSTLLAILG